MIVNGLAGLRGVVPARIVAALTAALAMCTLLTGVARADVNSFTLVQPLNNATVRENVPIRVPRSMLNQASYATVSIDGQFRAAPAVPAKGTVVYQWDTKSTYTTQDQPTIEQRTTDGSHTIQVALFDSDSNEIAQAASTVRVANQISSLPDGVHLYYKWRPNELVDYKLTSTMSRTDQPQDANPDPNAPGATTNDQLQSVDITFERSVEDISAGQILLRDHIVNNGTISGSQYSTVPGAVGVPIQTAFNLASKYWTVDKLGTLLTDNKPIADGDHFGFPILELPPRRINIGDSWQTDIMASLQFSDEHISILHGQARLDSFEWQDGYPTAKIIETYNGPAKFTVGGATADLPPLQANTVDLTRTVWFAYEAGIVVKSVTTMKCDCQIGSDQLSALGNVGGSAAPSFANIPPEAMQQMGRQGFPPNMPGFPGGPPNNAIVDQRQQQTQLTEIKLESDDTTNLSSIGSS